MRNVTGSLILTVALLFSSPSNAASIVYSCDFPSWSDAEGNHISKTKFAMKFAHDDLTGETSMIDKFGVASVEPVVGTDGITFLKRLLTGGVQSTTIISTGEAVHSRNTMFLGELVPTQYYGTCKKEKN